MSSRGRMKVVQIGGQTVQAFVPAPLRVQWPRDVVCREILELHERACISMKQLESTAQGGWSVVSCRPSTKAGGACHQTP